MLVIVLVLSLLPGIAMTASAADVVTYNGNELSAFKNRTKEEIRSKYSAACEAGGSYRNGETSTYYQAQPSLAAPYSAGKLTADTHAAMTAMTNFYRWLVGVQPLKSGSYHTDSLQAGALVRNWEFAHRVSNSSKPADMDQALWNLGANADHNILAMGYTPRGAISGWLDEGYSLSGETWNTIGHRMSLLHSNVSELLFGYAGSITIGLVAQWENTQELPFNAYPAPGYMPLNALGAYSSAWSIELNPEILNVYDPAQVIVRVTDMITGASYDCTEANNKLSGGGTLVFVQPSPGPNSYLYQDGSKFKVEVFGLTDVSTGKAAQISYTTEMFDVTKDNAATPTDSKPGETEPGDTKPTDTWANPFKDVKKGAWYYDSVKFVCEREMMNGMAPDQFAPNASLTRAMLVTVLYRYENEPAISGGMPFSDVKSGWYYDAVRWAAANGIVNGTSPTTFNPNGKITREQMVAILYRYAKYKGVDVSAQASLKAFPDNGKVAGYAQSPFAWSVANNIINGDGGYLKPQGNATRAQVAAVLQRYILNVIEK